MKLKKNRGILAFALVICAVVALNFTFVTNALATTPEKSSIQKLAAERIDPPDGGETETNANTISKEQAIQAAIGAKSQERAENGFGFDPDEYTILAEFIKQTAPAIAPVWAVSFSGKEGERIYYPTPEELAAHRDKFTTGGARLETDSEGKTYAVYPYTDLTLVFIDALTGAVSTEVFENMAKLNTTH